MISEKSLITALLNNKEALALVARDLQISPDTISAAYQCGSDNISGNQSFESAGKSANQCDKSIQIHIDGGARGNPGQGGAGVVLNYEDGRKDGFYYYFDHITNNAAEYRALQYGLDIALSLTGYTSFHFFTDSQLLCRQINGQYKVKNAGLLEIYTECKLRIEKLPAFKITHVPREQNKNADKMVNVAIDSKKMGKMKLTDAVS